MSVAGCFSRGILLLTIGSALTPAGADELSSQNFDRLHQLIKPQPGESRWAHIPWLLSLVEARKKAADEGKPMLIWSGGGSAPLGGC